MFSAKADNYADFKASLVVFLIALPLAMGIAMASGFPPIMGLVSGIVGGIVVGLLSGSPLQVSGPAAGLTVVVVTGLQQLGFEKFAVAVVIAGLLQMIGGFMKVGRWFRAISPTVLQAMLSGIGLLIVVSQIYMLFDLLAPGGGLQNLLGLPKILEALHQPQVLIACLVGFITIVVCAGSAYLPKVIRTFLPGPLLAVAVASVLAAWIGQPLRMVDIPDNLLADFRLISPSGWQAFGETSVIMLAFQLALIASAESLLCASAVDQLHGGPRTQFNRELFAQGAGNFLCGILGSLPVTGVIVRSSANVNAGAHSRLSTVLHGLWILLAIVFLSQLMEAIPLACLAGLLVYTGWKLINWRMIQELFKTSRSEFVIFISTMGLIVGYDLLLGVVCGAMLSGFKLLWTLTALEVKIEENHPEDGLRLSLSGTATFLRLPHLAEALEAIPPGARVAICRRQLRMADRASVELLDSWKKRHENQGGAVLIPE